MIYLPENYEKIYAVHHGTGNKHVTCSFQCCNDAYLAACYAFGLSVRGLFPGTYINPSGGRCFRNWVHRWNYYIRWCYRFDRTRADLSLSEILDAASIKCRARWHLALLLNCFPISRLLDPFTQRGMRIEHEDHPLFRIDLPKILIR